MPTTAPPHSIDPSRCPLCGGDNRCAMEIEKATGIPQAACWCMDAAIDPATRAQIPPAARGKACICAACATRAAGPGQHGQAAAPRPPR